MSGRFHGPGDHFEANHSLVERAIAGHEEARSRLAECAREQVLIWCLRLHRDRQRAEDSTQDVIVRMWKHVGDLQDPRAFPSWLYQIALNVCLRRYREDDGLLASFPGDVEAISAPGPTLEDIAATRDQLHRMLSKLDDGDRRILEMKYRQQMNGSEIGDALGISHDAARTRLHVALERLRVVFRRSPGP